MSVLGKRRFAESRMKGSSDNAGRLLVHYNGERPITEKEIFRKGRFLDGFTVIADALRTVI